MLVLSFFFFIIILGHFVVDDATSRGGGRDSLASVKRRRDIGSANLEHLVGPQDPSSPGRPSSFVQSVHLTPQHLPPISHSLLPPQLLDFPPPPPRVPPRFSPTTETLPERHLRSASGSGGEVRTHRGCGLGCFELTGQGRNTITCQRLISAPYPYYRPMQTLMVTPCPL